MEVVLSAAADCIKGLIVLSIVRDPDPEDCHVTCATKEAVQEIEINVTDTVGAGINHAGEVVKTKIIEFRAIGNEEGLSLTGADVGVTGRAAGVGGAGAEDVLGATGGASGCRTFDVVILVFGLCTCFGPAIVNPSAAITACWAVEVSRAGAAVVGPEGVAGATWDCVGAGVAPTRAGRARAVPAG
ncbi:hypothetical protein B0F90DRAFT_1672796 [Multifurca ochricompacta]|uniref:Uncharacterized protein n=1 Tax=Multifurca ochricompacta TaxID=376703 RepID=A0AAD4LTZ3_9AGAM|nr:hypothetical protein B0F90DRAFT_1672796 [Multifurca ochricompacta]